VKIKAEFHEIIALCEKLTPKLKYASTWTGCVKFLLSYAIVGSGK
jgi:hypothetical protein